MLCNIGKQSDNYTVHQFYYLFIPEGVKGGRIVNLADCWKLTGVHESVICKEVMIPKELL